MGSADNFCSAARSLQGPGQFAAGLLHGEVRVGGGHQRVIGGGLEVCLPGANALSRHERCKDRVVRRQNGGRANASAQAEHEAAMARVGNSARRVLNRAVMAIVVASDGDRRQPERPGLRQHCARHTDALGSRGDIGGLYIGQA